MAVTIVGGNANDASETNDREEQTKINDDDQGEAVERSTDDLLIVAAAPGRYVAPRIYCARDWDDLPLINATDFYPQGDETCVMFVVKRRLDHSREAIGKRFFCLWQPDECAIRPWIGMDTIDP